MLTFHMWVVWNPYQESRDHHPFPDVVFFIGCIKCMDIIELYHPERVLRQFGRVQIIPPLSIPPSHYRRGYNAKQCRLSYNSIDHFWARWRTHVLSEEKRSVPVTYLWKSINSTWTGTSKISHPIIQNSVHKSAGAEIQTHITKVAPNILTEVEYSKSF